MPFSRRTARLVTTLLPIPIAAGIAALLLLSGCDGPAQVASEQDLTQVTTVRVHAPQGAVALRGDHAGLSWSRGVALANSGGVYTWSTRTLKARMEFKPLLHDATWSRGPNFAVSPGQTVEIWPRFRGDQGRVERVDGWWSPSLRDSRPVWIYTPPSYGEQPDERFPVVYMHDGQNLFDAAYSFGGVTWQVQDAMDRGAADGSVREAIVVGIGNTADRIWEYTPSDGGYGGGGAAAYLDFVTGELKPQLDKNLRTLPGRLDTAMVGSSLGGLVSACAGLWHADVFGLVGAMSPSTWWDDALILGMVRSGGGLKPARVYVDSGDAGDSADDWQNTAALAQAYRDAGAGAVQHLIGHGDTHTESSWARRLPGALRFLLGSRAAVP
jgi:predicted alpha/beta superfamily hydrolase